MSVQATAPTLVVGQEGQCLYLTMLINHCQNVYDALERVTGQKRLFFAPPLSEQTASAIKLIKEFILKVRFYYPFRTNPNVQYGTARYRKPGRKEDRIYAIMQIYNLCIGRSARPYKNPPVEELVIEFAGAINHRSVTLGQISSIPRSRRWDIPGR